MHNIEKVKRLLKDGARISCAITEVCGCKKIYIPFNDEDFNIPIEDLNLGTRSYNALKRCKFNTLNDVIHHFKENGWRNIKNFGVTSAKEVFDKIIEFSWNDMSDNEKSEFLIKMGAPKIKTI